jgi:prephenate dehydrogenase
VTTPVAEGQAERFRALVIGAGLIGTSIGLALRAAGWEVSLADRDPDVTKTAAALGAGVAWDLSPVDLAIVAVPVAAIVEVSLDIERRGLAQTVVHVSSVQAEPLRQIEAAGAGSRIVGTHPMAGREVAGPSAGSRSLFVDRPWVVCRSPALSHTADVAVSAVIAACQARRVDMTADEHDAAVALVSHLPHMVSALLAGRLADADPSVIAVAGTGIRDMTRLADSDPEAWGDIVAANAADVARELDGLLRDGERLVAALAHGAAPGATAELLRAGRAGRGRLGGKHGAGVRHWAAVRVVIPDRPGALVDVLVVCRDAEVNIEDLSLEHATGQPLGTVTILVEPDRSASLAAAFTDRGWHVVSTELPHE